MSMSASLHNPKQACHARLHTSLGNDSLQFNGDENHISIFVPPHVAEHTAAAFNRAMQAVPDRAGGWTYRTKSGAWHISRDLALGTVFLGQHEEVTGDGDPGYLFEQSDSLLGCMDAIDSIEAEESCTECHALCGEDLTECTDDQWLCDSCLEAEVTRRVEMAEMADDDRAHAAMERAAGL